MVHGYLLKPNYPFDYRPLTIFRFPENLSEVHAALIRDENVIRSATHNGKIPWVSVDDVAAVAYHALVDEPAHNTEHFILGPELLSYGDVCDRFLADQTFQKTNEIRTEVAQILSDTLGRKITHVTISEKGLAEELQFFDLQPEYAQVLAALDTAVSNGVEERLNNNVLSVAGRPPKRFQEFVNENKQVWS